MGIEPTSSAWKAEVLPLNYTRIEKPKTSICSSAFIRPKHPRHTGVQWRLPPELPPFYWWRGEDSNLRRLSRQIYSLIPLTAREPLRKRNPLLS